MKIAFLSTFYPYRGGIAQFNASLYEALSKQVEVRAFTFTRQYPQILFPGKTQFVENEHKKQDKIKAIRILDSINPFSYFKTAACIQSYAPDILLISHWMPFFAPAFGTVVRRLKHKNPNLKVITLLHNVIPHEPTAIDRWLSRYFITANDSFWVMSQSVKQDLQTFSLNRKQPIGYHPHPIYAHFGKKIPKQEAKATLNISEQQKVLLFFGLIRDYKGWDLLLSAFANLDESYTLLLCGESYLKGKSAEAFATQRQKHPAGKRLQAHVRYIKDEEVALFFSAADLNILPYRTATQSGVLAVAFHFDLPVLVTPVGGLPEWVEDYQTGRVAQAITAEALEHEIKDFFDDKEQIQTNVENIQKFKNKFTWENLATEILATKA
ncbi:MAG: glycosyltransferase [Bernardetiaceae bacterium]|nr:glycosyltransferase [Bernardetiaceae bacterium]